MYSTLLRRLIVPGTKPCPKCGDPMQLEEEVNGKFWHCFCGQDIPVAKGLPWVEKIGHGL